MGDVVSILSEEQEAFVEEEIGDLLGEEADAIAADLGIPPRWENGRRATGPRKRRGPSSECDADIARG